MYIHSDSKSKSFGGYSFYESNQKLNAILAEKKRIHDLKEKGYKFRSETPEIFAAGLDSDCTRFGFNEGRNLNSCTVRNTRLKKYVSVFGKCIDRLALKNGYAYRYMKYTNIDGEYKYIWVITDNEKKVLFEYWYF